MLRHQRCRGRLRPDQQPRQIEPIILSTLASSRSMAGLVPSSGPFWGPLPTPFDESAVPNELVPGVLGLLPKAPPVTGMPLDEWCEPMPPPPPRANATVVGRLTQRAMHRTESFFMLELLRTSRLTDACEVGSANARSN